MRPGFVQSMIADPAMGPRLLGFSTLFFGVACFLQGDFTTFWQPVPEDVPFRQPLAFISAALLVASGFGLFFAKTRRSAAIVQIFLFSLYAASWLSRPIATGALGLAEHLAIVAGAITVATRHQSAVNKGWQLSSTAARILYGCCSIVFALAHVLFSKETAAMVPEWIPGDSVFWALFTGAGHFAVGIALIVNRLAFVATRWAALMYLSFAAFSWLPGAVTHPDQWLRWAGTAITLVMLAAVWLIGDDVRKRKAREAVASSWTETPSTRTV
jgi:uncharacterized membrane protein